MSASGAMGEAFAAKQLEADGYIILERNYRTRYGEVDLIAERDGILAFVEVKTRAQNSWYRPAAAVTLTKQRRLILAAMQFLQEYAGGGQPRFDVFEVVTSPRDGAVTDWEHLKGAFDVNESNYTG